MHKTLSNSKKKRRKKKKENRFFENREENWPLERTIRSCFLKITRDTPLIFRRDAAFHELFSWIGREEDESRSGELDRESRVISRNSVRATFARFFSTPLPKKFLENDSPRAENRRRTEPALFSSVEIDKSPLRKAEES